MRVFVTGATGFVGSAVVKELISAGHQVLGLARSDAGVASLIAQGAEVHRGDLQDLDSLRAGAAAADGVIHTGFIHDFSRFKEVCETDRRVIEALGEVLPGSNRPLIITSGTALISMARAVTEADMPAPGPNPRIASEEAADAAAAAGARVAVVRLPPSVHGVGDHGFVPMLIAVAKEKGLAVYTGDGQNKWPAVHRTDAAKVYRLALEHPFTSGARFHAVAEEGIPFRQIAEVIGKRLNIPVVSKTPEEAAAHFGWFAHFTSINNTSCSRHTAESLGWHATQPGLLADIDQDSYFPA